MYWLAKLGKEAAFYIVFALLIAGGIALCLARSWLAKLKSMDTHLILYVIMALVFLMFLLNKLTCQF